MGMNSTTVDNEPNLQPLSPPNTQTKEHDPRTGGKTLPLPANNKKRKMMQLQDGREIPEPSWSYHKPQTRAGLMNELYGPKLKIQKRAKRLKPASISF